jgi:hypothetical protein
VSSPSVAVGATSPWRGRIIVTAVLRPRENKEEGAIFR